MQNRKKLLLLLFFAGSHVINIQSEPIVVTIDNIVRRVDDVTACRMAYWGNKVDNACLCSIIKNSEELKLGKRPQDILKKCIDQGFCTESSIDNLLKQTLGFEYSYAGFKNNEDKNTEEMLKNFIISLADKSLVIKDIATDNIVFDQNGNFTPTSLVQFLTKAYLEGKLKDPAFKETICLKSEGLFDQKGLNTLQLFTIHSTCTGTPQNYILKEIKSKEEEVVNLAKANNITPVHDIVYPNVVPGLPIIFLPIAYFSYQYQGQRHVLSLMHQAEGKPLAQFIKDYKANPNEENGNKAAFAYENVGEKLARFQKRFMPENVHFAPKVQFPHSQSDVNLVPTLLQGDFHHGNVFVSDEGNVSFIDNERMARFFNNNKDIANDIVYVFYISLDYPAVTSPEFYIGFNKTAWVELTLKSFIEGYLKAFSDDQKADVIRGLNDRFIHLGWYLDHSTFGDFGMYYFKNKQAVDKVFEDLYKKYNVSGPTIKVG